MSNNSVLDLRDLFEEYEELLSKKNEYDDWLEEVGSAVVLAEPGNPSPLDEDEVKRLAALTKLDSDLNGLEDTSNNEPTLISEDYFPTYAEELANDLIPNFKEISSSWPFKGNINWKEAADDLKADYSEVEFDGETYFYRS